MPNPITILKLAEGGLHIYKDVQEEVAEVHGHEPLDVTPLVNDVIAEVLIAAPNLQKYDDPQVVAEAEAMINAGFNKLFQPKS